MDSRRKCIPSSYSLSEINSAITSLAYTLLKDAFDSALSTFDLTFVIDIVFNTALKSRKLMYRLPNIIVNKIHYHKQLGYIELTIAIITTIYICDTSKSLINLLAYGVEYPCG